MAIDDKVLVFAYGSNMCLQRIQARVSSARPLQTGYVRQRRFRFHKRGVDGSAKADAVYSASLDDRVWGVVYELDQNQKPDLDRHESLGVGYDETLTEVTHEAGVLHAWIYVARQSQIDSSLLPYSWYYDLVLHGARQHGLPDDYVEHIRAFESLPDPDAQRHAENRRILVR